MAVEVSRTDVQRLADNGAQLVEVLPRADYEDEHLPGALNIPLEELDESAAQKLQRHAPVIVYCNEYQ